MAYWKRLSTEDLVALLDGLEFLGTGLAAAATEDELGVELPVLGDAPLASDLGVDEGVVVLEVGANTLGVKGGPDDVLGHGIGLLGPDGELVGVEGELLLHAVDDVLVLEEQNLFGVLVSSLKYYFVTITMESGNLQFRQQP